MKRKEMFFLVIGLSLIAALFIRRFYLDSIEYKQRTEGVVYDKKKGGRGSVNLYLYNSLQKAIIEKEYGSPSVFDKVNKNDSVVKESNSSILKIYSFNGKSFVEKDSVDVNLW